MALAQQLDRALESLVEAIDEREDRGGLGLEHLARERAISHAAAPAGSRRS